MQDELIVTQQQLPNISNVWQLFKYLSMNMNTNIQGFETYWVAMHVGLYIWIGKQESKSVFPKKLIEDLIPAEFAMVEFLV